MSSSHASHKSHKEEDDNSKPRAEKYGKPRTDPDPPPPPYDPTIVLSKDPGPDDEK